MLSHARANARINKILMRRLDAGAAAALIPKWLTYELKELVVSKST